MNRLSKLNIMMTTDTVGGVWTYSCSLATALATVADVHLVSLGPRPAPDQRSMLSDPRVRLIETDLALEWQDPEGRDVANAQRVLGRLEAEIRPDIVHLNSFREAGFRWRAPTLVAAHSCVNSWAFACRNMDWLNQPKWRSYTRAVADGLNEADAWVAPTRAFHDVIATLYQPDAPGTVIWNGTAAQAPRARKQDFVFAAGRIWDQAKNVVVLANAADGLDWPVLVAGPGDAAARPGVTWLGQLPHNEVRARMQRAAIFASPALYEPFGLSVLEAAAAGCALVLSDIPSFRELWNQAAVFVDPTNTNALAHVLAELCTNRRKRLELQHAAHERSLRCSLSNMSSAYLRLYGAMFYPRPAASERVEARA